MTTEYSIDNGASWHVATPGHLAFLKGDQVISYRTPQKTVYEHALDYAAQLADSTAPGAPDVKAKELAEALTIEYSPVLITWDALIWAVKCLVKTLSERSAAPTAQQSLTAGGAVPTWRERAAKKWPNLYPDELQLWAKLQEAENEIADLRAAAPQPQVQPNEALDFARKMQEARAIISGMSLSLESFLTVYDEGNAPDSQQESALQAAATDAYKWLITDVKACMERDKLIRAADQQPVNPSGAQHPDDTFRPLRDLSGPSVRGETK